MASSEPRHLLVALHGYGASGAELVGVLTAASPGSVNGPSDMPGDVVVVGPDGPCEPVLAAGGHAWYPLTGHLPAMARYARELAPRVCDFVADAQLRHGVPPERTCLVGFSQGVSIAGAVLAYAPLASRAVLVAGRLPVDLGPRGAERPRVERVVDVLAVTGGRDRFVRQHDLRADLAVGLPDARIRRVHLPDLGHEVDGRVANLTMAHAYTPVRGLHDTDR